MTIPVFDLHSDTNLKKLFIRYFPEMKNLEFIHDNQIFKLDDSFHVTPEKLKKGNVKLNVQSLFLSENYLQAPLKNALKMICMVKEFIRNNDGFFQVYTSLDLTNNLQNSKTGIMLSIEGLEIIENDLDLLDIFYELGVRLVAPTWNRITPYMGNVKQSIGIFDGGKKLIEKMNRIKFIMDVSHMGDEEVRQTDKFCEIPLIASHSNARSVNPHPRNLSDDLIRIIKEHEGVMGINLAPSFLKPLKSGNYPKDYPEGFYWIYEMIDYISSKYDDSIISFGADFDGIMDLPPGITGIDFYSDFAEFLIHKGVSRETIEKIYYKNFLRILSRIT